MIPTCPRCSSPLPTLGELAHQAERLAGRATSARDALATMRMAIPSVVPAALVAFELELPRLAARLACHAGTCAPSPVANRAYAPTSAPLEEGVVRNSNERNDS